MPTEQRAQYQRSGVSDVSDARKRIDNFMREYGGGQYANLDVICTLGVYGELNWSDLKEALADADRDRQFAEAVRANIVNHRMCFALQSCAEMARSLDRVHADVYGTPCAAKGTR